MIKLKKIMLFAIVLSLLLFVTGCGKSFTATFDADGGTSVSSQEINKNGKVAEPASPTKEGYVFLYWELDGEEYDFNTEVTGDITLIAKYQKNSEASEVSYTVIFDSNGGSVVSGQTAKEGKAITKPTNPTKDEYIFLYWELDGKEYDFSTSLTKNITLTAVWEKETSPVSNNDDITKYTVTFNSNGGSKVSSKTITSGSKVSKPTNPTRSGYTFKGWYLSDSAYNFSKAVTKNITLTAKWEKIDVYKYTVEKIGGDLGLSSKVNVFKNGVDISESVAAVYDSNKNYLGRYDSTEKAIIVDNNDVSKIAKIVENSKWFNITKK